MNRASSINKQLKFSGFIPQDFYLIADVVAYNAINQPVTIIQPDSTELYYGYDKGGLLNQEGGGFFTDIGEGNYNQYWVEGKGTSWSLKPGDVLNLTASQTTSSKNTATDSSYNYWLPYPASGRIESSGLLDPLFEGISYLISKGLQEFGVKKKTADIAGGILTIGGSIVAAKKIPYFKPAAKTGGKELYNFGKTAAGHMTEPGRRVPLQLMDDVIKTTKGLPDPGGSRALMHYSPMWKNRKPYNLEILHDKASNSIWHFKYTQEALGPLPLIK